MRRPARTLFGLAIATTASLSALAAGPDTPRTSRQLQMPATAAISGVVTDRATGQPVAGAVVELGVTAIVDGRARAGTPVPAQLTDSSGRYAFVGLVSGERHTVRVRKPGYLDGSYVGAGVRDPRARSPIVLADGEWFPNADVTLRRGASVSGAVIDEAGEPAVDVFVYVLQLALAAGQVQTVSGPNARTDDRGYFRIGGLNPGRYVVVVPSVQTAVPVGGSGLVTPPDAGRSTIAATDDSRLLIGPSPLPPPSAVGRPQAYPMTFFPSAVTIAEAEAIDLDYGTERSGLTVALRPVTVTTISGRVEGPAAAVQNLSLRLLPEDMTGLQAGLEAATALTGEGGTFEFVNVPAGRYVISASRTISGYRTLSNRLSLEFPPAAPGPRLRGGTSAAVFSGTAGVTFSASTYEGDPSYAASVSVAVADARITDLAIPLRRGGSISGRVVVDAGSEPQEQASRQLLLADPAGGEPDLGMPQGRTDPNDPTQAFTINGLRPGEYFVRPAGGFVKSIMWNGEDYADRPFVLSPERDYTDVVITIAGEIARISGSIRDDRGAPVENAAVIYFPTDPEGWLRYGLQPPRLRSVLATTDGTYRIGVPAGEYFVIAVDPSLADAWKDPAFLERAAQHATRVTVDWAETAYENLPMVEIAR